MIEKQESKKKIPPYLPYKTLVNFLESMKVAVPARIDRSLMRSTSGTLQVQLVSALEYLNLINPSNGVPTDKLTHLVRSEGSERQKWMKEILTISYPFLFKDEFDLSRATSHQLQELFTEEAGTSGDTTRKCIAFFMSMARGAGINLSPHLIKPRGRIAGVSKNKPKPQQRQVTQTGSSAISPEINLPPPEMAWEQLLLSKFPSFDPAWSDEVKSKWFDAFDKLMKSGKENKGT